MLLVISLCIHIHIYIYIYMHIYIYVYIMGRLENEYKLVNMYIYIEMFLEVWYNLYFLQSNSRFCYRMLERVNFESCEVVDVVFVIRLHMNLRVYYVNAALRLSIQIVMLLVLLVRFRPSGDASVQAWKIIPQLIQIARQFCGIVGPI